MKFRLPLFALFVAGSAVMVGAAASSHRDTSVTKSHVGKSGASESEQIFLTVDDAIQELFADMSLINREAMGSSHRETVGPFFGFSRIPWMNKHQAYRDTLLQFKTANHFDQVIKGFKKEGWDVGLFGYGTYPDALNSKLRVRYADATSSPHNWEADAPQDLSDGERTETYRRLQANFSSLQEQAEALAKEALPTLLRRPDASIDKSNGNLHFRARTIRLTKEDCLKCHGDHKLGDPMAVIVLTARKSSGQ